jgi:glucose-1-phosphate cytidylyltransferase
MKIVILCGGKGTRLREETEFRPKPMVEIGGKPVLWHIMKNYASFGFNEFIICLGYKGNSIKEYFLNYETMFNDFTIKLGRPESIQYHGQHREQNFTLTFANTGEDTMTGGRIKRIEKYIDDDLFMVSYGDGLANVNIRELVEYHRSHGRIGTVTSVQPDNRFGVIDSNEQLQVKNFAEKPKIKSWINAGFFVFNKKFFNYLKDDENCILEREPLERLCEDGQLMTFRHQGFFFAMDTFREYLYLNDLWEQGNAPWKTWSE